MAKIIAGYGVKVETDTGHFVWLTEDGTTTVKARAMKFDSEAGATMERDRLAKNNPHANLLVEKFTKKS